MGETEVPTTSIDISKNEKNGRLKALDIVLSKAFVQVPHKLQNFLKVSHFAKRLSLVVAGLM